MEIYPLHARYQFVCFHFVCQPKFRRLYTYVWRKLEYSLPQSSGRPSYSRHGLSIRNAPVNFGFGKPYQSSISSRHARFSFSLVTFAALSPFEPVLTATILCAQLVRTPGFRLRNDESSAERSSRGKAWYEPRFPCRLELCRVFCKYVRRYARPSNAVFGKVSV